MSDVDAFGAPWPALNLIEILRSEMQYNIQITFSKSYKSRNKNKRYQAVSI